MMLYINVRASSIVGVKERSFARCVWITQKDVVY